MDPSRTANPTPSRHEASLSSSAQETSLQIAEQPTVLVVDDDPLVRAVLEAGLQQHGLAVISAATGQEALDIYRQHHDVVSVVLMDVQMPILDGPQTLLALRQFNPAVRCCFMTADSGRYTEESLLGLGAACVFPKPFRNLADVTLVLRQVARRTSLPAVGQVLASPSAASLPGSTPERRRVPRHEGNSIAVLIATPDPAERPRQGVLLNGSHCGLGLLVDRVVEAGAILNVCPAAPSGTDWAQVEVKYCRPQNDQHWVVGCEIVGTPPFDMQVLHG